MEPVTTTAAAVGAGAWAGNKLLGPTLAVIGTDLKQLYEKGRDRIVTNALQKVKDIDVEGQTNLRVTRDVFWNGSYSDDAICAEYFGGILASSRSVDGKDDTGVFYVDIIKSMSSAQLKLHYIIYRTFNKMFLADASKKDLNPGMASELQRQQLYIPSAYVVLELKSQDFGAEIHALDAKGLISNWQYDNHDLGNNKFMHYLRIAPTPLGVQLFAIANNMFNEWRHFSIVDFGDFKNISLPDFYGNSMDDLLEKSGLKKS